jgi:hypothetical protein
MTKTLTFVPAAVRSFAPNGVCALCGADILLPALPEPRTRRQARPTPALSQAWLAALAEERRTVAPLETLGWGVLALAAGLALVSGLLGSLDWVGNLTGLNAWVAWMLGAG